MMRQTTNMNKGNSSGPGVKHHDGISAILKDSSAMRNSQSVDRNMQVKMNPKVLETWINETL